MNQHELYESEKAVLALLKEVKEDSLWGIAIKKVCDDPEPVKVLRLFYQLKSQACDNPELMKRILGTAFKPLIAL
jgi:hypothetical protein